MSTIGAIGLSVAGGTIVIAACKWLVGVLRRRPDNSLLRSQIESELLAIDGLAQLHDTFWRAMRAVDRIERGRRP